MPEADRPRVGFLGTGLMGAPMARNLLEAGFDLTVWNRTAAKAAPLVDAGARSAATPAELAAGCDVVLACLASVEASDAVFFAPDGVLAGTRAGQVLVDHGTNGPELARRLAAAAEERGARALDAPVSGGPEGAAAGTLTIMVGGDETAFERARPALEAMGSNVRRLGGTGAGALAKLVNQLLTFLHAACAAEALVLARRAGVEPAPLMDVLRTSFGQSRMLERTAERVGAANYEAGAPLRLFEKDLGLIEELARRAGAELPLGGAARGLLERARSAGLGDSDLAGLVLLFEDGAAA